MDFDGGVHQTADESLVWLLATGQGPWTQRAPA